MSEVRITNERTGGQKGSKPERVDLLPVEALFAIARVYGFGASKYDDHNWRRGYDWSLSYAALQRHIMAFWSGENTDPESGLPHLAHAGFHVLTLLTFMDEHPELDDRYHGAESNDEVLVRWLGGKATEIDDGIEAGFDPDATWQATEREIYLHLLQGGRSDDDS